MTGFIVTEELVERMLAIEIANLQSRLRPYARREGNPAGVFIRNFGRATAFIAQRIPVRFFNSVLGVGPEIIDQLDEITAHYRRHGAACAFEVVPGRLTEALGLALSARGYAMAEFHAGLARTLSSSDASLSLPEGVTIEEIRLEDQARSETFLDTYLEGWGTAPADAEHAKANMREWRSNENWRYYLALCDGEAAGAAILDVRGKTAMLGSASTRPSMRGKSVQNALLTKRIADAARLGCDLIVGGAYFGTSSMRNQQRTNFSIAFTRGIWIEQARSE